MSKNLDVISSILLILVILGGSIYASSLNFSNGKVEVYEDFDHLDLLNTTGVEIVTGQDYNSLVFSEGFGVSDTASPFIFSSNFEENLTGISEYTLEYKVDISNVSVSDLTFYSTLNDFNESVDSDEFVSNDNNVITLRKFADGTTNGVPTTQLTGSTGLVNGRDEFVSGSLVVTLRVSEEDDFIVGTFDFTSSDDDVNNNVKYTNVVKVSEEVEDLDVGNIGMMFAHTSSVTSTLIGANNTFILDYVKLEYLEE